jgi:hypothetical protein
MHGDEQAHVMRFPFLEQSSCAAGRNSTRELRGRQLMARRGMLGGRRVYLIFRPTVNVAVDMHPGSTQILPTVTLNVRMKPSSTDITFTDPGNDLLLPKETRRVWFLIPHGNNMHAGPSHQACSKHTQT